MPSEIPNPSFFFLTSFFRFRKLGPFRPIVTNVLFSSSARKTENWVGVQGLSPRPTNIYTSSPRCSFFNEQSGDHRRAVLKEPCPRTSENSGQFHVAHAT